MYLFVAKVGLRLPRRDPLEVLDEHFKDILSFRCQHRMLREF